MPLNVGVELSRRDRDELVSWTCSPSIRAGLAQRARVALLAADGVGTNEIVRRVGLSKPAVIGWKRRWGVEGIAALADRPKSGRPRRIDPEHCAGSDNGNAGDGKNGVFNVQVRSQSATSSVVRVLHK
jgi:hypothetical protein